MNHEDVRIDFGKDYKGWRIGDLPRRFLEWVAGNPSDFDFKTERVGEAFRAHCASVGIDWSKKRPLDDGAQVPRNRYKKLYEAYLVSDVWREKRVEFILACERRCKRCGDELPLPQRCALCDRYSLAHKGCEVHHRHYDTIGEETLGDVEVLCCACHAEESCGEDRRVAPAVVPGQPRERASVVLPWEVDGGPPTMRGVSAAIGVSLKRFAWIHDEAHRLDRPMFVESNAGRAWFSRGDSRTFARFDEVVKRLTGGAGMRTDCAARWDEIRAAMRDLGEKVDYEAVMRAAEREGLPRLPGSAERIRREI